MMREALESAAPFSARAARHENVSSLGRRVAGFLPDWPEDKSQDALQHALALEGLRCESTREGRSVWRWVDYLPPAMQPPHKATA
jgi:hypothetical protein